MTRQERPILFSGPMVRAILGRRKTETRRIMRGPKPECPDHGESCPDLHFERCEWVNEDGWTDGWTGYRKCPHGRPGDLLIPALVISGYDCPYCADALGRIWSKTSGAWSLLRPNFNSGYQRLTLRKGGRDVNRTVHRLVCEAFYGPPPWDRAVVRHLDGDRANSAPENLDWGTYAQNWSDRKAHGRGIHEEHHNAKLSLDAAEAMRASGSTASDLAREYGVDYRTVQRVLAGETWVESYEQPPRNMPKRFARLRLRVEDVRVERLQEISEEDAAAEGFPGWQRECWGGFRRGSDGVRAHVQVFNRDAAAELENPEKEGDVAMPGRHRFRVAWDEINGKRAPWSSNPWVWVVRFSEVERD